MNSRTDYPAIGKSISHRKPRSLVVQTGLYRPQWLCHRRRRRRRRRINSTGFIIFLIILLEWVFSLSNTVKPSHLDKKREISQLYENSYISSYVCLVVGLNSDAPKKRDIFKLLQIQMESLKCIFCTIVYRTATLFSWKPLLINLCCVIN